MTQATTAIQTFVRTSFFDRVLHLLKHTTLPMLLVLGRIGSGKSETVRAALAELKVPVCWIPITRATDLDSLLGHHTLNDGNLAFVKGMLHKAITTPNCVIVMDDAHAIIDTAALQFLNPMGDTLRQLVCSVLGQEITISEGVRLILIANEPSSSTPSWERSKTEMPEQLRDRSVLVDVRYGLPQADQLAITSTKWPESSSQGDLEGIVELVCHLSTSGLSSYTPSLRALLQIAELLRAGMTLDEAFLCSVASKYTDLGERTAAIAAFEAKFDRDPTAEEIADAP